MGNDEVAATARTTASIRARETRRAGGGLFQDPLADVLAGPEALAALAALPEAMQARTSMFTVVRTRLFDDWLMSRHAVAQIVLLGAGFDSRAFRLNWPAGMSLWELDQASLLAAKAAILGGVGAVPGCRRTAVAVDFADPEWPDLLQSAGFRAELPTAWLAEGLLPYLAPPVALGVLDGVGRLGAPGSHFAADFIDEDSIVSRNQYLAGMRELSPALKGAPFQFGANDPASLLADHGWSVSKILQPGDEGANFGRVTTSAAGPANLPLPRLSFVMAQRAG